MRLPRFVWEPCKSYSDASSFSKCIYVFHAKKSKEPPIYIGKANKFDVRYASGYRYLIDALLRCGHKLHIARLTSSQWENVEFYENSLIRQWKPLFNRK